MTGLSIGELERRTDTPASTLRFYERKGLLPPPPRASGRRRYPADAADRVLLVRMWQRAGFSLGEIAALLAGSRDRAAWQSLVRTKIAEVDERQRELQRSKADLEHALLCRAPDWTACERMRTAARAARAPSDR